MVGWWCAARLFEAVLGEIRAAALRRFGRSSLVGSVSWSTGTLSHIATAVRFEPHIAPETPAWNRITRTLSTQFFAESGGRDKRVEVQTLGKERVSILKISHDVENVRWRNRDDQPVTG